MRVQPHYYFMRQVEPCHQLGEIARRPSLDLKLSFLFPNNNDNNDNNTTNNNKANSLLAIWALRMLRLTCTNQDA